MSGMRVLVVGTGAREHALAWRFAEEQNVARVLCAPGNPLVADVADLRPEVGVADNVAIVALAAGEKVDMVVVGPEAPLVAGMADDLSAARIACFGPTAAAARLEASKAFAREVCAVAGVNMARGRAFEDLAPAIGFADELGGRVVVKADGLAAGKGVTMCESLDEASEALTDALHAGRFGTAGRRVIVEEWLDGEEASVIALCDGRRTALLPAARDHKRLAELDDDVLRSLTSSVFEPVLAEMAARGAPFRGALFAGLMLTSDGPRVLEFNVRLGDPETQSIVTRLATPLAPMLLAAATGDLASTDGLVPSTAGASVALTLASAGYPDRPEVGRQIAGVDSARRSGALVFGAGVRSDDDGRLTTAGGRVLTVVGRGSDLDAAARAAHVAADLITFEGKVVRHDIGGSLVGAGA
jgi:phosphoribosylamine--glycine ligase